MTSKNFPSFMFQNTLLDLLGGSDDDVIEPYKPEPTKHNISSNQDLLDLLG